MEKYGVNKALIRELMALGLVKTEEEGREKVASGQAEGLIKLARRVPPSPATTDDSSLGGDDNE